MTLETQVTSLELSKSLKELGLKQESAFWYEQTKIAGRNEWKKEWELCFNNNTKPYTQDHIVSAFTVAELGEMLPERVKRDDGEYFFIQCPHHDSPMGYRCWITRTNGNNPHAIQPKDEEPRLNKRSRLPRSHADLPARK